MLRTLIRFEFARLLFSPAGVVVCLMALALLAAVQQWVLTHPVKAVSTLVLLVLARRAFRRLG